jgi:CPA1 family monovalent cation:H+ antiporter
MFVPYRSTLRPASLLMPLFETLLTLMLVAIVFLQLSRKLRVPYPTMLAIAGMLVAALPWAPDITIDPSLALALFVTLGLFDAAVNLPLRTLRQNWVPLVSLAGIAVLLTVAAVAAVGVAVAGLPVAVAVTLGAIVAPPDAAAAGALLSKYDLPKGTSIILRGESLLNDAVSLLIYTVAVASAAKAFTVHSYLPQLALAVPGGVLLGALIGRAYVAIGPRLSGTLGGTLLEFVTTFGTWIVAERLHLSAILAVVVLAMVVSHHMPARQGALHRVNSFAVWEGMVFCLNVLAFLLLGLQARHIVLGLWSEKLLPALILAGAVLVTVVAVRLVWVFVYGKAMAWLSERRFIRQKPQTAAQDLVAGWCGIRGLVTMATALALPADFPSRDLVQLCALAVVLGTLVIQGLTLGPLLRRLRFPPDGVSERMSRARVALSEAAMESMSEKSDRSAEILTEVYAAERDIARDGKHPHEVSRLEEYRRYAVDAKRRRLLELRRDDEIDDDTFRTLQQELDWAELAAAKPKDQELLEG